jgi:parvulin-like peptidyl-prolyl isomerase
VGLVLLLAVVALACSPSATTKPSEASAPAKDDTLARTPVTPITVEPTKDTAKPAGETTAGTGQQTPINVGEPPVGQPKEEKNEDTLPAIVAKVGDDVITGKEFGRQLDYSEKTMRMRGMPVKMNDARRRDVLNDVINERVLAILAKGAGLAASDEEVNTEFEKTKSKMPSEQYFKDYLNSLGLDEAGIRELVRQRIVKDKFVEAKTKDMKVSDEDLKTEYDKLKEGGRMARQEDTTDVSHILVKVPAGADDAAWAKAKEKIDAARARIKAGEKFADVAKEVSEDPGSKDNGGMYRETRKGRMVPEFEEAMNATPVGEVSEPLKTKFGWHILTVTGKHQPGTVTMEEVKDDLSQYVMRKKKQEAVAKLVEEAKSGIKIEILLPASAPEPGTPPAPGPEPAANTATPEST